MTQTLNGRDPDFVPSFEAETQEQLAQMKESHAHTIEYFKESIAELELAMEDEGWRRLGMEGEREFSRSGLDKIIALARIMYLKNPLIQRAVEIRAFYIWGQGVEIQAEDEKINKEVIQPFLRDVGNRREFMSHAAAVLKEKKLQSEGNLFFVLVTHKLSGRIKLRSLPVQEVRDVVYNPEDRNEVWFYQREWTEERKDLNTGKVEFKSRKAYYPDWTYNPKQKPKRFGQFEVKWDQPVYHVKVGGFDDMRFGVPETYAAIDWARAYKGFLEDWASLVKAISRFAWKVSQKQKRLVGATRQRLESRLGVDGEDDNPPPTAGSTWVGSEDVDLVPINKSGATTSATDGKMLRLMVASAVHLPDTILSNDPQQGALATAKTLDRPTELAMTDRQKMWEDILRDILGFVALQAVRAGANIGKVMVDEDGMERVVDKEGEPLAMTVTFPPVIEHDLRERITSIISAMTLEGQSPAGVAPINLFRRLILSTLGVKDIDKVLDEMGDLDIETPPGDQGEEQPAESISPSDIEKLVDELHQLREQLV